MPGDLDKVIGRRTPLVLSLSLALVAASLVTMHRRNFVVSLMRFLAVPAGADGEGWVEGGMHVMPRFRQEPYAERGIAYRLEQPANRWC